MTVEENFKYNQAIEALKTIKEEYGQVCENYETCRHPACASSYGAWAVADIALHKIKAAVKKEKERS